MEFDLQKLNSATKYPSILTYHGLGERGALTEDRVHEWDDSEEVTLTEKVDGTNSRVIRTPDKDWFIGSREELLTAKGDRVPNPALGIVEAIRPVAERLEGDDYPGLLVFFLETYGKGIGGNGKQYSGEGKVGHRLFDVAYVPLEVLDWDRERIASWRDNGGQRFAQEANLHRAAVKEGLALTPRLGTIKASALPRDVEGTYKWLEALLPSTHVALDAKGLGRAEGVVLRTSDRSTIAKARFEDYERTMKRRNQPQKGGKR